MSKLLTDTQMKKVIELLKLCEKSHVFVFDNLLVKGIDVHVVKQYIRENPSQKFRTWLIDKKLVIEELLR